MHQPIDTRSISVESALSFSGEEIRAFKCALEQALQKKEVGSPLIAAHRLREHLSALRPRANLDWDSFSVSYSATRTLVSLRSLARSPALTALSVTMRSHFSTAQRRYTASVPILLLSTTKILSRAARRKARGISTS